MGVIKVHGSAFSTAMMRVLACLHEKELDYEIVEVDMRAREHKKEPFISLNPFGQVPAFEDGDLKLFESRAITRYIATEYAEKGTHLLHDGTKAMAILNVGLEVEAHQFDQPSSRLTWELAIKLMFGMTTNPTEVEEYEPELNKVLDVYEACLAKSKYLVGNKFSLVDLHHLPNMYYLMSTPVNKLFESRPHVCAWRAKIMDRPSWKMVVEMAKSSKP